MKQPKMLIEHGLIPGHTLTPDEPGMENSASIIPDDQKMNPNCVCPTRTCPLHGFCQYCAQHHAELNRALEAMGLGEHCHFHHCKQDRMVERYGLEGDDPRWRQSTCWAGLLIAIGNEYAPGNPAPLGEKRRRVEGFTRQPGMAEAIRDLEPRGMGRNKQLVAGLVRRRWFGLLSLMYAVKNRR